jgi:hypothetical protein
MSSVPAQDNPSDSILEVEKFFVGFEDSRPIFDILMAEIDRFDAVTMRVTKSQIAFQRRRGFAWAWVPGRYLRGRGALLVLSVALPRRDPSPRWKEIVEPATGRFMHHLELNAPVEIDHEVVEWLREAWSDAA